VTPVELLQQLIQFDTTNPPGNEWPCIDFLRGLLEDAGAETELYAREPERPNLVARLSGGSKPPLLLQGHVDVVTTAGQHWTHPPFGGKLVDGYVWGRGALDMKGGVAMLVSAFLRAARERTPLPGDVILLLLADEEGGGDLGAKFMVEEHAHLFEGVRYALSEFGGFSQVMGGRTFYPIQVAEKQICWLKATVRGAGGHGALMQPRGGTMARLGKLLAALDRKRLPVHVTPAARAMFTGIAEALPRPQSTLVRALLNPKLTDRALPLLGERGRGFEPLLRNTVSATIVRAGEKINVVPAQVEVELDARALPGFTPEDVIAEVKEIIGKDVELELVRHDPGPPDPDLALFDMLAAVLREVDPDAIPIPLLQAGVTDARFFAQLGIQTYGFLPMRLPPDFPFLRFVHAADERIPAKAVEFGAEGVFRALQRF
jgi:acetylornithine deacetylase/succinyl-diaminopimelate desuccinylase-like protein